MLEKILYAVVLANGENKSLYANTCQYQCLAIGKYSKTDLQKRAR